MNIATGYVVNKQLGESIVGKTISKVIAYQNPHTFVWFAMEPARAFTDDQAAGDVAKYLTNKIIERVNINTGGYGLYNFLYIGKRALMSDIVPRYTEPKEKPVKKHQLLLEFEDGSYLSYTASLGGALFLFEVDKNGDPIGYKSDFPLITTSEFTYDFFKALIEKTEGKILSVKQLLATKNRIPGIDNNLLQDILWEAQVNPKKKIDTLNKNEINRIYKAIKTIPSAIIAAGGKDIDKDVYGNIGGFPSRVSRNTVGKPCARCGTKIVKEAYLGGSVFYCPACQKI
jgi:formamidopyrimidine-DNA glycosylase